MKYRIRATVLGWLVLLLLAESVFAITLEQVSNELVCQCGCGLVLNNCNHSDCGVAIPMRQTVTEKIEHGETKEQIITYFVALYGDVVRAAPTKRGFNLTVWVLPFIGITVGIGIITSVIILWIRRRRSALSKIDSEKIQVDTPDKYERIFKREIKDFE